MHKKLIKELVERGNTKDMEYLEELLVDLICDLKDTNYLWYKNIEMEMYKRIYGKHLNEELAMEWVSEMENKDGTKGQHWSIEQTTPYAGKHNKYDWYAALNSVYSDFYNQKFSTDDYIKLANDWLDDEDVAEGKALNYYFYVVKR